MSKNRNDGFEIPAKEKQSLLNISIAPIANKSFAYPMFFNDGHVRSFLNQRGYVYTVRQRITRKLPEKRIAVTGTYYEREQIGFYVWVELVHDPVRFEHLEGYLPESGFTEINDWLQAIHKFNKGKKIGNIALYKAVKEGCQ